ncbi:MAG: hypothetical protein KGH66_01505, partial [Candidatus Micrarchaeota archaeon]|nr:hypothetical protein [Candidatus Micrarchaeota archaeon]
TSSTNSSSVSRSFSYNIPSNQAFSLTFETTGNANYTEVDPNVIIIPTNIVFYIPITFTNPVATATAAPFVTNVIIDSAANAINETTAVNNIEFFDGTGNIVQSWLEGNILNENQNALLNSVAQNEYWVKLPLGIPASGNSNVFIGFAGNFPSAANDLWDCVNTGGAPQLTAIVPGYGRCDNGAQVFTFYSNFVGTTLPSGWSRGAGAAGNIVLSNGLQFQSKYAAINSLPVAINQITEAKVWDETGATATNTAGMVVGGSTSNAPVTAANWVHVGNAAGNLFNGIYLSLTTGHNAIAANGLAAPIATNDFMTMFNGNIVIGETAQPNNAVFYINGIVQNTIRTAQNVPLSTVTYPISFGSASASTTSFYVNWTRQRPYPPSGAMPTVTFGTPKNALVTTFTEAGLATGTTWNVVFGGNKLATKAAGSLVFTTNQAGGGTGGTNFFITNVVNSITFLLYQPNPQSGQVYSGNTEAITFNGCELVLTNTVVNFLTVSPGANAFTANLVTDTNNGPTVANILLDGTNWAFGATNYFVANTVWDFSSNPAGLSGNTLGLAPGNLVDTLNQIASGTAESIYFGTQVPALTAPDTYSQTITIENKC